MSLPHFTGATSIMSFRGLLFWAVVGALGVAGLAQLGEPEAPVVTLKQTLSHDVVISRL